MKTKPLSNKFWLCLWALYHGIILVAFLFSLFFTKGIRFDGDFTSMMPSALEGNVAMAVDRNISSNANRNVFILASHSEFPEAKLAAEKAYSLLKDEKSKFLSVSLYSDLDSVSDVQSFLSHYRFNLIDSRVQAQLLSENGPEEIAAGALAEIYSGFSISSLENIERDPFMLDSRNLRSYLAAVSDSGTKLSPKDGVLARQFEERWYVMIRASLTDEGAALASKENAVPLIYEKCLPLEQNGVRFVFYGSPFHSYKSSSAASSEISVISAVSMAAVIVILILVFRSPLPVFASIFSIVCSLLSAFCAVHLLFGKIHLTALVFGTSLIGSCIDYSLHYFINWKTSRELDSASKIRAHLFNGLFLSLVSTEICFAFLFLAPFSLLRQMAVFSFIGILSSFLTVSGFYAVIPLPPEHSRSIPLLKGYDRLADKIPPVAKKYAGVFVSLSIVAFFAAVLASHHGGIKIQNNISNLYKMEGRLKDDTITAYKVLDYSPSSYLVVSGNSMQELLETEESLSPFIPDKFVCVSRFIPSIKKQQASIDAASRLAPLAYEQFEMLGFDEESEMLADKLKKSIDASRTDYAELDKNIPMTLDPLIKMLYAGEIDGKFYSVILPSSISDESYYRNFAASVPGVIYMNKVADISAGLDRLSFIVAAMFVAAFVVIAVIIKFFYGWRDTLKILSIPVLSVLIVLGVFVLAGLKIEFFCITGIILVFGLGLDYVVYRTQNKNDRTETFAIALSFLTTAISFGALALSSFVPVHVIGLSIFSGLAAAFVCAVL